MVVIIEIMGNTKSEEFSHLLFKVANLINLPTLISPVLEALPNLWLAPRGVRFTIN